MARRGRRLRACAGSGFAFLALLGEGGIAVAAPTGSEFVTLGTNSGPIPNARRSEPANLLRSGDQTILIDAGDGATVQLAKAGVPLAAVQTIIISHLHFDHTGGLFAFLSERYQAITPGVVTVYGPPGTQRTVDAMIAAMAPMIEAGTNVRAPAQHLPEAAVKVVEIGAGARFRIGDVAVTAAANSHYGFPEGSTEAAKYVSLSFRFDMPDRSIVYTGDTGPSGAVEMLAHGADLLVSEIMDPAAAIAAIRTSRPDMPAPVLAIVDHHFRTEHLSPDEAGLLAERAGVKALILTHNAVPDDAMAAAARTIAAHFHGRIVFANDLQRF